MRKIFKSAYIIFAIAVIVFTLFLKNQNPQLDPITEDTNFSYEYINGEIQKINPPTDDERQYIVKTKDGARITASVSSNNNFNTYKVGDKVLIYKGIELSTGNIDYEISDYYHQRGIIGIFIIFAITAIIVARRKGVTAITSVAISLAIFYFIFIKMLIAGYSPILACIIFALIVTAITIPLIHGFNRKSLSSIFAIFIGYGFSFLIAYWFKDLVQLGATPGEEFRMLGIMYPEIGLSDILLVSLFLGAIGALIDTAVSISSAIFESQRDQTKLKFKKVYSIGMEVGKDILGSMINTLLFAYLAAALPFLILISLSQGATLTELINYDFIALELTRTFLGAISLVILIPITASISAYFLIKFKRSR